MGQDTGYGMMGKDPNPNHRTEQEYRALIRSWKQRLKELHKAWNIPVILPIIDEMEKEVS